MAADQFVLHRRAVDGWIFIGVEQWTVHAGTWQKTATSPITDHGFEVDAHLERSWFEDLCRQHIRQLQLDDDDRAATARAEHQLAAERQQQARQLVASTGSSELLL